MQKYLFCYDKIIMSFLFSNSNFLRKVYIWFLRQKQRHALYTGQSQTCPLPEGSESGWWWFLSISIAEQENKGARPLYWDSWTLSTDGTSRPREMLLSFYLRMCLRQRWNEIKKKELKKLFDRNEIFKLKWLNE